MTLDRIVSNRGGGIGNIPCTPEQSFHGDRKDASANARAAEHASEGQAKPFLEPVGQDHVAHTENHPACERPGLIDIDISHHDLVSGNATTYTDAEALAEEELPVLSTLGREEHADDKHHRGDQYEEPEVPPIEQSSDGQSGEVKHRVLCQDQR